MSGKRVSKKGKGLLTQFQKKKKEADKKVNYGDVELINEDYILSITNWQTLRGVARKLGVRADMKSDLPSDATQDDIIKRLRGKSDQKATPHVFNAALGNMDELRALVIEAYRKQIIQFKAPTVEENYILQSDEGAMLQIRMVKDYLKAYKTNAYFTLIDGEYTRQFAREWNKLQVEQKQKFANVYSSKEYSRTDDPIYDLRVYIEQNKGVPVNEENKLFRKFLLLINRYDRLIKAQDTLETLIKNIDTILGMSRNELYTFVTSNIDLVQSNDYLSLLTQKELRIRTDEVKIDPLMMVRIVEPFFHVLSIFRHDIFPRLDDPEFIEEYIGYTIVNSDSYTFGDEFGKIVYRGSLEDRLEQYKQNVVSIREPQIEVVKFSDDVYAAWMLHNRPNELFNANSINDEVFGEYSVVSITKEEYAKRIEYLRFIWMRRIHFLTVECISLKETILTGDTVSDRIDELRAGTEDVDADADANPIVTDKIPDHVLTLFNKLDTADIIQSVDQALNDFNNALEVSSSDYYNIIGENLPLNAPPTIPITEYVVYLVNKHESSREDVNEITPLQIKFAHANVHKQKVRANKKEDVAVVDMEEFIRGEAYNLIVERLGRPSLIVQRSSSAFIPTLHSSEPLFGDNRYKGVDPGDTTENTFTKHYASCVQHLKGYNWILKDKSGNIPQEYFGTEVINGYRRPTETFYDAVCKHPTDVKENSLMVTFSNVPPGVPPVVYIFEVSTFEAEVAYTRVDSRALLDQLKFAEKSISKDLPYHYLGMQVKDILNDKYKYTILNLIENRSSLGLLLNRKDTNINVYSIVNANPEETLLELYIRLCVVFAPFVCSFTNDNISIIKKIEKGYLKLPAYTLLTLEQKLPEYGRSLEVSIVNYAKVIAPLVIRAVNRQSIKLPDIRIDTVFRSIHELCPELKMYPIEDIEYVDGKCVHTQRPRQPRARTSGKKPPLPTSKPPQVSRTTGGSDVKDLDSVFNQFFGINEYLPDDPDDMLKAILSIRSEFCISCGGQIHEACIQYGIENLHGVTYDEKQEPVYYKGDKERRIPDNPGSPDNPDYDPVKGRPIYTAISSINTDTYGRVIPVKFCNTECFEKYGFKPLSDLRDYENDVLDVYEEIINDV
jgi:hypothetical protein